MYTYTENYKNIFTIDFLTIFITYFLIIFITYFLIIFTYDFINAETWAGIPAINPDFIIAKPPAKLIDNDIRNSINAFAFPP